MATGATRVSVAEFLAPPDDGNRQELVRGEGQDYLAGGVRRAWCVYPQRRFVQVYDAETAPPVVRGDESLGDEELLPGFVLPLGLTFPDA